MSVKVHAIIDPKTGEVQFEVEGVVGNRCSDITQVLQQGHEVLEERYTEEYYDPVESPAYVEDL